MAKRAHSVGNPPHKVSDDLYFSRNPGWLIVSEKTLLSLPYGPPARQVPCIIIRVLTYSFLVLMSRMPGSVYSAAKASSSSSITSKGSFGQ